MERLRCFLYEWSCGYAMIWRWVGRRRLTLGLVGFFAVWYLAQLAVVSVFGTDVAVWLFYSVDWPSLGYLLAPLSHNMADVGHLRRNAGILLVVGGFAEPYLEKEKYAALLLAISFASIVIANALSLAFGTKGSLAGPSGGILGLWAYIGVRNRSLVYAAVDSNRLSRAVEASIVAFGFLTPIIVPAWDLYSTGFLNVSHAVGVLLGYATALAEALPQTRD